MAKTTFYDPQKPFFYIKDNKNLYIQIIGYIWAYVHAKSWDF